jgi:hypothetical protein
MKNKTEKQTFVVSKDDLFIGEASSERAAFKLLGVEKKADRKIVLAAGFKVELKNPLMFTSDLANEKKLLGLDVN